MAGTERSDPHASGALRPARSYYGWRARIGLILPSLNTVMEPELALMAPPGVATHASRLLLAGSQTPESYRAMARGARRAAEELASAEVDVVAYGCTVGSIGEEGREVVAEVAEASGAPVVTTFGAVLDALRALGVGRVSVATPYVDAINEVEREHLETAGVAVAAIEGLGMGGTTETRRAIGHQSPRAVYALARRVDRPEAEAIFISCTNMATAEILAPLERDLGKPVVSSNAATLWAALRKARVSEPLTGYGRLLELA